MFSKKNLLFQGKLPPHFQGRRGMAVRLLGMPGMPSSRHRSWPAQCPARFGCLLNHVDTTGWWMSLGSKQKTTTKWLIQSLFISTYLNNFWWKLELGSWELGVPLMITLTETNIAPENKVSQKESRLPTMHFQGRCWLWGVYHFNSRRA